MRNASRHVFRVSCAVSAIAITLFATAACVSAQVASTPTAAPAFEVATIKPAGPFDPATFGFRLSADRVTYTGVPLRLLIQFAYNIRPPQVSGPKSIDSDHFDIVAIIPESAARDDFPRMLQSLLKERFKLAFHIEEREQQIYALVVGKNGPKLQPSPPDSPEPDPDAPMKPEENHIGNTKSNIVKNPDGSSTVKMGKMGTQTVRVDKESGTLHMERSKMTMKDLARELPVHMGTDALNRYTVVDETGLTGNYQVAMDYPLPGAGGSDDSASDPEGAGALTRSLYALGLKLELRKVPIDVYVIDHVEKPSEN